MPTSNLHLAPRIINLVEQVPHHRVLDVGPGWGKYATLLREYLNTKPGRIDAVEAWEPYIVDHRLAALYDHVYHANADDPEWVDWTSGRRVAGGELLRRADVVLMVDVIEHMTPDQADAVIDRTTGRVVICTPVEFFDNGPNLPPTEKHVSHWTVDDFERLAAGRELEYLGQQEGGWCVRLGPLSAYRPPRSVTRHASAPVRP